MRLDIVEGRSIYKKGELQYDHAPMPASGGKTLRLTLFFPFPLHRRKCTEQFFLSSYSPHIPQAPTLLMIHRRYPKPQPSFAITSPVINMLGKLSFACPNPMNILILVFHQTKNLFPNFHAPNSLALPVEFPNQFCSVISLESTLCHMHVEVQKNQLAFSVWKPNYLAANLRGYLINS